MRIRICEFVLKQEVQTQNTSLHIQLNFMA